jgi:hypothetical protein
MNEHPISDALFERSKSDDKLTGWPSIVGSEVRAAIKELREENQEARRLLYGARYVCEVWGSKELAAEIRAFLGEEE